MTRRRVRASRCGALAALVCAAMQGLVVNASAQDVPPGIEGLPASAPAMQPGAVVHFPAHVPATDASLLQVPIPAGSNLRFMVDPASVARVELSLVRYTLVVRSPSGFRNISYEGLDCSNNTWHVYATWSQADARWVANPGQQWRRADPASNTDVHGVLDRDYWCDGRWAAGDAPRLVRRLRNGMHSDVVHP